MTRILAWPVLATVLVACYPRQGDAAAGVFTLYRSSPFGGDTARVHVATFDTQHGEQYNRENCETAAQLFGSQPTVMVRYWCEPDRPKAGE